jgi:hypothetical protein
MVKSSIFIKADLCFRHIILINNNLVEFEVLTTVSTKMAVFIALMMEAARTSEMLVNFYQTTWRYNPGDSHLQQ